MSSDTVPVAALRRSTRVRKPLLRFEDIESPEVGVKLKTKAAVKNGDGAIVTKAGGKKEAEGGQVKAVGKKKAEGGQVKAAGKKGAGGRPPKAAGKKGVKALPVKAAGKKGAGGRPVKAAGKKGVGALPVKAAGNKGVEALPAVRTASQNGLEDLLMAASRIEAESRARKVVDNKVEVLPKKVVVNIEPEDLTKYPYVRRRSHFLYPRIDPRPVRRAGDEDQGHEGDCPAKFYLQKERALLTRSDLIGLLRQHFAETRPGVNNRGIDQLAEEALAPDSHIARYLEDQKKYLATFKDQERCNCILSETAQGVQENHN